LKPTRSLEFIQVEFVIMEHWCIIW
jgi:hypothetical protein